MQHLLKIKMDSMGWANPDWWGDLGHNRFLLISPKLDAFAARAAIRDCISPRPYEMTRAVPSAFCT